MPTDYRETGKHFTWGLLLFAGSNGSAMSMMRVLTDGRTDRQTLPNLLSSCFALLIRGGGVDPGSFCKGVLIFRLKIQGLLAKRMNDFFSECHYPLQEFYFFKIAN